jgi:endonuclease-8
MPEGDSIFRAARTLHAALAGQRVIRFEARTAPLTRGAIAADPAGAAITSVEARGKHLLMHFDNGRVLRSHMRMHGSWHLYRPGERWRAPSSAVRAVIETEPWTAIAVDVPVAEWVLETDIESHGALSRLGPDLLSPAFDADAARARLRETGDTPIAEALLDQSVMAGIGNVFKSEILFIARVSPFAPAAACDDDVLRRIVEISRTLLRRNVQPHARQRNTTGSMNPAGRYFVYERGGEACRVCGTAIQRAMTGPHQRSTYWCPQCQPTISA